MNPVWKKTKPFSLFFSSQHNTWWLKYYFWYFISIFHLFNLRLFWNLFEITFLFLSIDLKNWSPWGLISRAVLSHRIWFLQKHSRIIIINTIEITLFSCCNDFYLLFLFTIHSGKIYEKVFIYYCETCICVFGVYLFTLFIFRLCNYSINMPTILHIFVYVFWILSVGIILFIMLHVFFVFFIVN